LPLTSKAIVVFVFIGSLYLSTCAAQEPLQVFQIPKVSRAPRLEDFLNGIPREAEAKVNGFRQREPGDGAPVSQETTAYLSYDEKNLYIVFVCKESSGKVWAHLSKRDDTEGDDQVSVYLDTFDDHRRAYYFAVNPLGIQTDGIFRDEASNSDDEENQQGDTNLDLTFDTLWYSRGLLTRDGYLIWIAIPFKSLRFSKSDVQSWGIALGRTIVRTNEEAFAPYITDRLEGLTPQLAKLDGLRTISPGRNIQLIPYGLFSVARNLNTDDPARPLYLTDNQARGGLDAKIALHNAWTFDLTLNPDFSQVESDDPRDTVDQRFEVFFPERRPFFLENSDFFQTPINLFYSRHIEDPQFGLRLTGKQGPWGLGVLAIDDREPGIVSLENGAPRPADDPLRGLRAGIGVIRLQRELGDQSNMGALVTSRDFGAESNRVYSFDTHLNLNPNWAFTGQFADSQTRGQIGSHTAGVAGLAEVEHSGRHFTYSTSYEDRSPNFDGNQLGFIQRTDIRQITNYVSYLWRPEGERLLSFGPSLTVLGNWNRQKQLQDFYAQNGFTMSMAGSTQIQFFHNQAYELFDAIGFHKFSNGVTFSGQPRQWLGYSGTYSRGTDINYFPGNNLTPFLGKSTLASFDFTLRPTPRLRLDEIYIYSRLGLRRPFTLVAGETFQSVFNSHLLRWKVNYQFTKALSLRGILDYDAVLSNPTLIAQDRTKNLATNILLAYQLNPGTALYAGYIDGYENLSLEPDSTMPRTFLHTGPPARLTGRQFFVKVSYLWRF